MVLPKKIGVSKFKCTATLKFYEKCKNCAYYSDCADLKLAIAIIRKMKELVYYETESYDKVLPTDFGCLVPLKFIEKSINVCPRFGKCADEIRLRLLLLHKCKLDYTQ